MDETADRLIREGAVPPMIIVGIDNAGKDRIREYMPHRSMNPMMLRVQGRYYPDFLMKEVMPFVGRNYRVAAGPENTGLGGSSLGALIALYTAMVRPGVIGRLLVESPSLWASHRQAIKESRSVRIWPERIYLGVGTAEAGSAERSQSVVDDVRELAAILRRAVLSEKRLRLVIKDGAGHNEAAWAERFPEALQFLVWRCKKDSGQFKPESSTGSYSLSDRGLFGDLKHRSTTGHCYARGPTVPVLSLGRFISRIADASPS